MDKTSETLKKETEKWLAKLEEDRPSLRIISDKKEIRGVLKNLDAYISDTKHFLEKGDLIRAFEAVVFAWGLLEACEHLGLIERNA
jgi:hypothetical protein